MKKLLLCSAAVAAGLAFALPARADGVDLGLGGHFKGYGVWIDQDDEDTVDGEARSFDILKETEVHFSGETTLDNGLTVGAHVEAEADTGDSFEVDESYAYFSGAWGRVNFGDEDGAAYLLQVAAPSADSNFDGIRQYIQPVNYGTAFGVVNTGTLLIGLRDGVDYDNDLTTSSDKFTYLSPVFNGFQVGVSYTPDVGGAALGLGTRSITGVTTDEIDDAFGDAWEGAARYEGQFEQVGFAVGGGYTHVSEEDDPAPANAFDDWDEWNVGLDLDWGAFGLGAVWTEHNNGADGDTNADDNETWVVGVDYTTGPYKLGASYLNNENSALGEDDEVDTDRWTGGVVYTYGPGMTFRGSVSWISNDTEDDAVEDLDSTSVLLGTQIDF